MNLSSWIPLLVISSLVTGCYSAVTSQPNRRGFFDNFLPPSLTGGGGEETNTQSPTATQTNTPSSGTGLFNSVSSWFGGGPQTPDQLAKLKKDAEEKQRHEEKVKRVEKIRQTVLRIPGVGLADAAVRKATSAIGLGLGFASGTAQNFIDTAYSSLRAAKEGQRSRRSPSLTGISAAKANVPRSGVRRV